MKSMKQLCHQKNHMHPPALATQEGIAVAEKGSLKQSPVTTEGAVSWLSSSKLSKKSSVSTMSDKTNSSSSSSSITSSFSSLLSDFSTCAGVSSSAPEVAGEEGFVRLLLFSESCSVVTVWGTNGFWRVEPAREFLCVGAGWLCSAVYVTMNIVGSDLFLSTCFLAKHPFELLHL